MLNSVGNKIKDFTGQVFGRLTVIKYAHSHKKPSGSSSTYWECLCSCGNTNIVVSHSLTSGGAKSCGCLQREKASEANKNNAGRIPHRKSKGEAGFTKLFKSYRRSAKKRGLYFDNSIEFRAYFKELTTKNCINCGLAPEQVSKRTGEGRSLISVEYSSYLYNGVDRIDPEQGYYKENCVPCCAQCNTGKWDYTQKEFNDWIVRIYQYKLKTGQIKT